MLAKKWDLSSINGGFLVERLAKGVFPFVMITKNKLKCERGATTHHKGNVLHSCITY